MTLVLNPNFYKYLFFYFIYHVYKKISIFISDTDIGLNYILFRMYYKEKSIMYVNIPKEYQQVILRYIELGLHRNMKKHPELLLDNILGEFCYYINNNCEFHLTKNNEYINNDFSFIEITNKLDTPIYPYYYTIKFYKFLMKLLYGNVRLSTSGTDSTQEYIHQVEGSKIGGVDRCSGNSPSASSSGRLWISCHSSGYCAW